ncbi:MAG: menaquinone biosynthesis protein [Pyrinomonadaceae bacterium]
MHPPRISASSYSNTAPLIWSFLYGSNHGKVEIILDNAPARSAELLLQDRVDAALVPVIASQFIEGVRLIPDVCVGAKERVRSVCLVTGGKDLSAVKSVALDTSSRTSIVLTKIIFREFLGFEPEWRDAAPNISAMVSDADAALLIGDPALVLSEPPASAGGQDLRTFDLAELWNEFTGLGFVFAMWMTRRDRVDIDFAAARDEGLSRLDEIAANYRTDIGLSNDAIIEYLSRNISYSIDDRMAAGLELYLDLAATHGLIDKRVPFTYL